MIRLRVVGEEDSFQLLLCPFGSNIPIASIDLLKRKLSTAEEIVLDLILIEPDVKIIDITYAELCGLDSDL